MSSNNFDITDNSSLRRQSLQVRPRFANSNVGSTNVSTNFMNNALPRAQTDKHILQTNSNFDFGFGDESTNQAKHFLRTKVTLILFIPLS